MQDEQRHRGETEQLFSLVVSGAVEGDQFGKEAGVDPVDSGTVPRNFT